MCQDKLSEEVRKQYDGPGEKGSRTEPDAPVADPGPSEEGDGDGRPLVDRLKALEVSAAVPVLCRGLWFSYALGVGDPPQGHTVSALYCNQKENTYTLRI